jgi:FtsZ-interacting cell division protein YlmF
MNLEGLDHTNAVRVIDFMSGVCYGLEGQGHAMKLGDTIFLFTPCEFEISSDEVDYGENRDFYFKEITAGAEGEAVASYSPAPPTSGSERRSWER